MSSQMEVLSNQFNSLITQYQNTYQEFVNTISEDNSTFVSMPNSAFVGGGNIGVVQNSSVNNCMSSCSSTSGCAGATYDNNLNSCSLVGNSGNIIPSNGQTAIVKQALYYSYQLKQINDELTSVNNSMMELNNNNSSEYQQTQEANGKKAQILQNNYSTLETERYQIEQLIREYETLNSAQENGEVNVSSNYYSYMLYLVIAIFLFFSLVKLSVTSSGQRGGGSLHHPIIYIFLALVILFNAYVNINIHKL